MVRGERVLDKFNNTAVLSIQKIILQKLGEDVQKRMYCQCQNDFSPGGTIIDDFSTLTVFDQILRPDGR